MRIATQSIESQSHIDFDMLDDIDNAIAGLRPEVSVLPVVRAQQKLPGAFESIAGKDEQRADEGCKVFVRCAGQREITLNLKEGGSVQLQLNRPPINTLVLSGGGAKGVAYPGAIIALEQRGVLEGINKVSGSSAGAITAAVVASGMDGKSFEQLSNNMDLIGLLDSPNKSENYIQSMFSLIGNFIKKTWGTLGLLMNILPRVQSSAVPLEKMLVEKCRESVIRQIDDHPEAAKESKVAEIKTKLDKGGDVTFGDLAVLNRHIPNIKMLNITGTALFEGRAQMVVFSSDLTPNMSIARAAHISAALPVVFESVDEQGHPFQMRGEHTRFQDGGVMLNTPVPEFFDPYVSRGNLRDSDNLILKFEGKQNSSKPGKLQALADWFLGAPHTSRGIVQARGLESFKDQLVIVPLNTDFGDFRGMLKGTLNFFMPEQEKIGLQKLLYAEIERHLDGRVRTNHDFSSLEEALLAMNDEMFAGVMAEEPVGTAEVSQFRNDARSALLDLAGAIATAETCSGDLKITKEITSSLALLDSLASTPERRAWLGKELNRADNSDFMRLMAVLSDNSIDSPVWAAAIEAMKRRDSFTISENIVREIIDPALCRYGQSEANTELLLKAKSDLSCATTKAEINLVLDSIVECYQHRNKYWFGPATPNTVEMAMAWRTTEKW